MKNHILLGLLFSLVLHHIQAQTHIPDNEVVSGVWTKAGSPYLIEGTAIVPEGKTLSIEAGVEVQFKTGRNRDYEDEDFDLGVLFVYGSLKAEGNHKEWVKFTRQGSSGFWGVIFFDHRAKDCLLRYCHVEYAYHILNIANNDNATGAISMHRTGDIRIEDCLIVNNGWTGLNFKQGASPKVKHCTIAFNQYGVECNTGSSPSFEKIILWSNKEMCYLNGNSQPSIAESFVQKSLKGSGFIDISKNKVGTVLRFENSSEDNFRVKSSKPKRPKEVGVRYKFSRRA